MSNMKDVTVTLSAADANLVLIGLTRLQDEARKVAKGAGRIKAQGIVKEIDTYALRVEGIKILFL